MPFPVLIISSVRCHVNKISFKVPYSTVYNVIHIINNASNMVTTETCLLLGLVHIVLSSRTALLASLTGSRITGFEASARSLSTLGSDVSLAMAWVPVKVMWSTRNLPASQGPCWQTLPSGSSDHPCGQCSQPPRGDGCWSFQGSCSRPLWIDE